MLVTGAELRQIIHVEESTAFSPDLPANATATEESYMYGTASALSMGKLDRIHGVVDEDGVLHSSIPPSAKSGLPKIGLLIIAETELIQAVAQDSPRGLDQEGFSTEDGPVWESANTTYGVLIYSLER